jgi:hypothetical protein
MTVVAPLSQSESRESWLLCSIASERLMPSFLYKGYTIRPRTFQLRGSDRWTLDLLIGRNGQLRAFTDAATYATRTGAETACADFGRHIIDGDVKDSSVADLR